MIKVIPSVCVCECAAEKTDKTSGQALRRPRAAAAALSPLLTVQLWLIKRATLPRNVASMIVSESILKRYELPMPNFSYFLSSVSAMMARCCTPTYSMTISSTPMGSIAKRPHSWILLLLNLSCFLRNCNGGKKNRTHKW